MRLACQALTKSGKQCSREMAGVTHGHCLCNQHAMLCALNRAPKLVERVEG
jgi:phosphoribosyl-dephospho-CoA transferase